MNMQKKNYYGTDGEMDAVSYLEFGSINIKEGTKKIWGYWHDQEAYDLYMFSRYARDLIAFRDFAQSKGAKLEDLNKVIKRSAHDKILDYIFKYAGVVTACDIPSNNGICESGSSLMGLIDECLALDNVFADCANHKRIISQKYIASDISEMMNKGAKAFYPNIDMSFSTAPTIRDLLNEVEAFKLFYGLSVSMRYALRTSDDLAQIGNKSQLSIFNRLSFNLEETSSLIYGSGKYVYVVSLPEFIELTEKYGISVKYLSENMQRNKDGDHTVRASIAMSKDINLIDKFISNYNTCIDKANESLKIEHGEWYDIKELLK